VLTLFADLTPAAAVALGLVPLGVFAFVLAFAPANSAYFDPRRFDESVRALPVLLVVGPALADVRRFARLSLRDAAISAAALLMLVSPAPEGAR
jgi:hypothetical protein